MSEIYSPKSKVVVASSTEGLLWDGAKECYLVTHNAAVKNIGNYKRSEPFDHLIEPKEFTENKEEFLKTGYFNAALKLRPLVKKAWHYFLVLDMIKDHPDWVENILANSKSEKAYLGFINKFEELKASMTEGKSKFLDDIFYAERGRMDKEHHFDWLDLYEPIENRWEELGKLAETKKLDEKGKIISGFVPSIATAKDEEASHKICIHFVKTKKLDKRHYSDEDAYACTIPRNLIVGKERIESREKLHQLEMLRKLAGVPKTRIWNLNDMYKRDEQIELFKNNYVYQFFLPGYVFYWDIERAKNDEFIRFLGENFADQISKTAEDADL